MGNPAPHRRYPIYAKLCFKSIHCECTYHLPISNARFSATHNYHRIVLSVNNTRYVLEFFMCVRRFLFFIFFIIQAHDGTYCLEKQIIFIYYGIVYRSTMKDMLGFGFITDHCTTTTSKLPSNVAQCSMAILPNRKSGG